MPRTRTKYIWPPPTLTPHTAAILPRAPSYTTTAVNGTSVDEPRAKKPKLESISSSLSPARSHETERVADASADWDPESGSAPPSMEVAFAAYMRMPVETQIKRYREWRRFGSVHDDYCLKCRKSGPKSLLSCSTCPKSFHEECTPPGSLYNEKRQWYCAICVYRKWHEQPPTLTPPASPSPESTSFELDRSSTAYGGRTQSNSDVNIQSRRGSGSHDITAPTRDSQALSILAEISRSMFRGEEKPRPRPPPAHTHRSSSDSRYTPHSPGQPSLTLAPMTASRSDSTNVESRGKTAAPGPASLVPNGSGSDSQARRSRFATLSSEVDSALCVLYRELESVTSLRQQIGDLESEVVKLRQDVSIRDNQLILLRRSMSSAATSQQTHPGISQAEIDRLRVQAAKVEEMTKEAETVRARNEALEQELIDAKAESAAKDKTLNEWKGRLVSLIGN